jgi:hypothetical protein
MQNEFLLWCPTGSESNFVPHVSRDFDHMTVDFDVGQWGGAGWEWGWGMG